MKKLFTLTFVLSLFFTVPVMSQANSELTRVTINKFELRWKDSGSGNGRDLAFWHPVGVPDGYYISGSWGSGNNNENPNGNSVTYAWKTSETNKGKKLVVPAIGLKQIWTDSGSGADWDGSLYLPECPPGYYALGLIANRSHSAPDLNSQKCGCFEESVVLTADPKSLGNLVQHTWQGEDVKSILNPIDDFTGDVDNVQIVMTDENPRRIWVPKIGSYLSNMTETFNYFATIKPGTTFFDKGNNAYPNKYKYHDNVVTLRLAKGSNDNRLLDADGNSLGRNGTKVQTWPYISNNKNQEWRLISTGTGSYYISLESSGAKNHCFLDANGDRLGRNDCNIQLWEPHHFDNQKWRVIENSDGTVHVQSVAAAAGNNNSLDYGGSNQGTNGQGVKLYTYDSNNPNEKWYLHVLR